MHNIKIPLGIGIILLQLYKLEASRKFAVVAHETIENCASPDNDAKAFDLSNFEIIAESDMDVFLNGTVKFGRKFNSPVPTHIFAEKFDRGRWNIEVLNAKRPDFCKAMHGPTESWYYKLLRLKCPLLEGVKHAKKRF